MGSILDSAKDLRKKQKSPPWKAYDSQEKLEKDQDQGIKMAKKEENKIVLERTYNVPLRRDFLKAPKYKRAKKAVSALKAFLVKHMKSDDVRIGKYANLKIWENGIRNPPHHIQVIAKKDEKGVVKADLVGAPVEKLPEPKKTVKKEEKKDDEISKLEEKREGAKKDQQEKAKKIQKEEIKELKEEHAKNHPPKEPVKPKDIEEKPTAPKGKSEMTKP